MLKVATLADIRKETKSTFKSNSYVYVQIFMYESKIKYHVFALNKWIFINK